MSLFGKKEQQEIEQLKQQIEILQNQLSPEQQETNRVLAALAEAEDKLCSVTSEIETLSVRRESMLKELDYAKSRVIELGEMEIFEDVGLYQPTYTFATAEEFKVRLAENRAKQKQLIKDGKAVTGSTTWTVNNSRAEGKKMVSDMQKLLLRAFNAECEHTIERVTVNNFKASLDRIEKSYHAISNLGKVVSVAITSDYFWLKRQELIIALEYEQKKRDDKEAQKEARAQMREEAKLEKEIEEARKKLTKEQTHYQKALKNITAQLAAASEEERVVLLEKKAEIESQLEEIDKGFADVDYRAANAKAGYVYIISNIGAFGEDVYKIGMTRRLVPMERVDELGDASVPFDFDVHAMIFSADAPALETALHKAFADRKLNHINQRREFFRVSLDEIKKVVKEHYDQTVEFVDVPPAEQYRQSLAYEKAAK